jgi:hypothetical protein
MKRIVLASMALGFAVPAWAQEPAPVLKRIAAEEARQGVAADGSHVYAIDNSRIGKYRVADGTRVAQWSGDPAVYPHLNSCMVAGRELVCASSNYPALPQTSSVEFFDARTLKHLRSHAFGISEGSLTAFTRHDGAWWAVFAQYGGKGGIPGKDNRDSQLVRLNDAFQPTVRYVFPAAVLERMGAYSASGASWTSDGRLAVSGHDLPEIYILSLPQAGATLRLDATLPVVTEGQAIDWDPARKGAIWGITRKSREMVLSDLAGLLAGK